MKSRGLYSATISFDVVIEADNMKTAEYLANMAIPKHLDCTTNGGGGSGSARFENGKVMDVSAVR